MQNRKIDPKMGKTDPDLKTRNSSRLVCKIDQIQASLKSYSKCLYITDLVSVINFYINRYVSLEITTTGRSKNSLRINTQVQPPAN